MKWLTIDEEEYIWYVRNTKKQVLKEIKNDINNRRSIKNKNTIVVYFYLVNISNDKYESLLKLYEDKISNSTGIIDPLDGEEIRNGFDSILGNDKCMLKRIISKPINV